VPGSNSWTSGAPLSDARSGVAASTGLDGRIYAIGGISSGTLTGAVEVYNATVGSWSDLPSLPTPRQLLGAATGADGRSYAIGGADAQGNSLATVEIYDPATSTWSTGPSLNSTRQGLGAATSPEPDAGSAATIYAFAGCCQNSNEAPGTTGEALATQPSSAVPESSRTLLLLAGGLAAAIEAAWWRQRRLGKPR
jgi:hypothetical protein